MIKINYKSDFKINEKSETIALEVPFVFSYYVFDSKKYVVSFDGHNYVNCKRKEDGSLDIIFNNPNLGVGPLKVERKYAVDDKAFADGVFDVVTVDKTDVFITSGKTFETYIETLVVPPFLKGDKGDPMTWDTMTETERGELVHDVAEAIDPEMVMTENEKSRQEAERSRQTAEQQRSTTFNTLKGEMQSAITAGNAAAGNAQKVVDEYDEKVAEQDSKLSELGSEVENKSTSTYLKNIAKFDETWTAYQGVMDVIDSSRVSFTATNSNSNVNKTLDFGLQSYNIVVISGSIDTKGLTSTQYMQAVLYTQDGNFYSYDFKEATSITGTVHHYNAIIEKDAITKVILRFRVPESNGITIEFINPFVIGLKNRFDLELLGDWFADVKPYYSDYARLAKESEIARELDSESEIYTSKADAAKFPLNLVLDSKFKDLNWLYPTVSSYEVNNGVFEVKKVSTAAGIVYQTFEFPEQKGDYIYLSLKIKTAYSLTADTYLEAIVYYSDGTYTTLMGQKPVNNVDGYYYLEVAKAITKPINKIIYRIRLKNINGIDNVGVFIKEPFAAVVSSKDYDEIYKGNALYYEKNNTSVAVSSLTAFNAKNVDMKSFFNRTTPIAGKKLLTLGDSITFGKKWQPQLCKLTGMEFLEDAVFTEYASNTTIEVQHLEESKKTVSAKYYPIGSGNTNGIPNVATAIGGSAVRAVAVEGSEGNAVDGSAVEVDGVAFSVGRGPGESFYERSKSVHVYNPDIIIIMGGQNDGSLAVGSSALGSMEDAPYNGGYILQSEYNSLDSSQKRKYSFYAMYKGMLLNLIKNNPKAAIYCCGTMRCLRKQYVNGAYSEDATINYFYEKMLPDIKTKNAAIKEIAEYYGCKYVDMEGLSINPWNNSEWSSDTGDLLVHPNVERGNMMAISIRNQM